MDLKKEKIGFIGLGIMGLPMASNLIKDEFNLVIYNRTLSKCSQLEEKGAVVVQTPADVAKNAKVIIDKNSPFLKSVILNKGGREKIKKGISLADFNDNGKDDMVFGTDNDNIYLIYDDGTIAGLLLLLFSQQFANWYPGHNKFRSATTVGIHQNAYRIATISYRQNA